MPSDTHPRPEFVEPLRDWFVDELRHAVAGDTQLRRDPPVLGELEPADHPTPAQPHRPRRRWLLLANAAAVLAVLVGLVVVRSAGDEPVPDGTDPVRDTAAAVDPATRMAGVCERYSDGAETLPMGASPAQIVAAADDVQLRLEIARDELVALHSTTTLDLERSVELVDEAIEASERLRDVAGGDRNAVDRSVENVALIVAAWSRELAEVTDGACSGLPTLREVS